MRSMVEGGAAQRNGGGEDSPLHQPRSRLASQANFAAATCPRQVADRRYVPLPLPGGSW